MRHITEEEQVLACYGEPLPLEQKIHLTTCASCRAAVEGLGRIMKMAEHDQVPEPDASFEDRVWATLQWQMRRRPSFLEPRWLAAAAAALILLVLGFGAGQYLGRRNTASIPLAVRPPRPAAPSGSPEQGRTAALHSAGRNQLDRSSRLLVDVANQSPDDADLQTLQASAEELLTGNRLLRAASGSDGGDEVRKLLEDIEPILLELAHSSPNISSDEVRAIQGRIESRKLLFKLRVVSSGLRETQQHQRAAATNRGGAKL